jgi:hypothetical protein
MPTWPHVLAIMEEINKLSLASDNDRPALLAARKAAITDIARKLNGTLASELNVAQAYHVTRKGAFNLALLVKDATAIFSDEVQAGMDSDEQYDIIQAGRCLAFEVPTAAAFHIFRATESVMRRYYIAVIGTVPAKTNWGAYPRPWKTTAAPILKSCTHLNRSKTFTATRPCTRRRNTPRTRRFRWWD